MLPSVYDSKLGNSKFLVNGGTEVDIQAAIDAADLTRISVAPGSSFGHTYSSKQSLVELSGNFVISNPIRLGSAGRIHMNGAYFDCTGMDDADYWIDGKAAAIFGWRWIIDGQCSVMDAPNGINTNTGTLANNTTVGSTTFKGIQFHGVRGTAFNIQCRSSIVNIQKCLFDNVHKFVDNWMCDEVNIEKCTGHARNTSLAAGVAPFTTRWGRMMLSGGIYTPAGNAASVTAPWIEMVQAIDKGNGDALVRPTEQLFSAHKTRFGGENGGLTTLRNRCPPLTFVSGQTHTPGVSISFDDCHLNSVRPAILLHEIPNYLSFTKIQGFTTSASFPYTIDWDASIDAGTRTTKLAAFAQGSLNYRSIMYVDRMLNRLPGAEIHPDFVTKNFVHRPAVG